MPNSRQPDKTERQPAGTHGSETLLLPSHSWQHAGLMFPLPHVRGGSQAVSCASISVLIARIRTPGTQRGIILYTLPPLPLHRPAANRTRGLVSGLATQLFSFQGTSYCHPHLCPNLTRPVSPQMQQQAFVVDCSLIHHGGGVACAGGLAYKYRLDMGSQEMARFLRLGLRPPPITQRPASSPSPPSVSSAARSSSKKQQQQQHSVVAPPPLLAPPKHVCCG